MTTFLPTEGTSEDFLPYEEAKRFVHTLGLRSSSEWKVWARQPDRPANVPTNPNLSYKDKGWNGWDDWLGRGEMVSGITTERGIASFEDARKYVRTLGITTFSAWMLWARSKRRPASIPIHPHKKYSEWRGYADWLGVDTTQYLAFEKAREFVQRFRISSTVEWKDWAKSAKRPAVIPTEPDVIYEHTGWAGWPDWLGRQRRVEDYWSYEDAKAYVHRRQIKSGKEWQEWSKSGELPLTIPHNPDTVYKDKGWEGWKDWFGIASSDRPKKEHPPFEVARRLARSLELPNSKEYKKLFNADPTDITKKLPHNPQTVYKDQGWAGWIDWLGVEKRYAPFTEARAFARKLGLKSGAEWYEWASSGQRPPSIPRNPQSVYKNEGWIGIGDWLGVYNIWNRNAILSFLRDLEPLLESLRPTELYAIMRQNGMLVAMSSNSNSNARVIRNIHDLFTSKEREAQFKKIAEEVRGAGGDEQSGISEIVDDESAVLPEVIPTEETEQDKEEQKAITLDALKGIDQVADRQLTLDEETLEFLICSRVNSMWQAALNADESFSVEALRSAEGGTYFTEIKNRFLTQYTGALTIPLPAEYRFKKNGKLTPPNLMQRLTAFRVKSEKRIGNWSGVGAGKTLSAILTSRVIGANLTVIIALNNTLQRWFEEIMHVFPDSVVEVKERGKISFNPHRHNYIVLNFESFQLPYSVGMVDRLVATHKIDFIVIDEVQSVKQNDPSISSLRRQVIDQMLRRAAGKNPDLRVLGMSATPVINNLYEAKALLELIRGESFNDLQTFSSVANAIAMHEKLVLHGIRYKPKYEQSVETEYVEIDGEHLLPSLTRVTSNSPLITEKILLEAKLDHIIDYVRRGTFIYTHYIAGIVERLQEVLEQNGYSVGLLTGGEKSGLSKFIAGEVDVLIGSISAGTGIDGLQGVCDQLIIISLPWTAAEYEQLIGRIHRQGSVYEKVRIIIPQVVLTHGEATWSWDKRRLHRIQYKKTLADAALDGVVPEGELASIDVMHKMSQEALRSWIGRVEQEGKKMIDHGHLQLPLADIQKEVCRWRFGSFYELNRRLNKEHSSVTHTRMSENPAEWYYYHTLYREERDKWIESPLEVVIDWLRERPHLIVGDFGCGEALLAESLTNTVHSFDHVAINNSVISVDMRSVPLQKMSVDVAVFCLSLIGDNYHEYLKEAFRILKSEGRIILCESIDAWRRRRTVLQNLIDATGFINQVLTVGSQFFYINAYKP